MHAGEPIEGTLLDIDDECLIISDLRGSEIILEADAIAMVVRLSVGTNDGVSDGQSVGGESPSPQASARAVAMPVSQHVAELAALPAAAVQALAELERRVRTTPLEIPAIDWDIYDGDLDTGLRIDFRRDLVAVRNRYEYAVKTKEEDRILKCVSGLRKIADDYETPDALQIAGRMLWRLGRREQARDLFAEAAEARDDSFSCFDLAIAQRLTNERDYATATLRGCVREDSQPHDLALMALTSIVLTENTGWAELAGASPRCRTLATWRRQACCTSLWPHLCGPG